MKEKIILNSNPVSRTDQCREMNEKYFLQHINTFGCFLNIMFLKKII